MNGEGLKPWLPTTLSPLFAGELAIRAGRVNLSLELRGPRPAVLANQIRCARESRKKIVRVRNGEREIGDQNPNGSKERGRELTIEQVIEPEPKRRVIVSLPCDS